MAKNLPLISAEPNKLYSITEVRGTDNQHRRLLDMGFTPGSELFVAGVAPFGGTILVSLRGFSVALRESAAETIMVVKV